MPTDTIETPAGATPTETVTPERLAAESGNFGAFQDATRERRQGKPPASITRPKDESGQQAKTRGTDESAPGRVVPGRDGQPAKGPKPEDREADDRLTSRIREAIDTSTADLRRQNRELEEQLAAIRKTSTPEKPAATGGQPSERKGPLTKAEIAAYQAMPGAPKLDDKDAAGAFLYDTAQEHAVALSQFISDTRATEKATAQRTTSQHAERVQREAARVSTFQERIEAFKREHDAILIDNGKGGKAIPLSPEVGGLHGYAQLAAINADRSSKGLAPVPASVDHAIAEELYDSEIPMQVARFLTEHPEELATLRSATAPAQLTRMFGGLEQRVRAASPAKKTDPTVADPAATPKKETTADLRREAEAAVDRSVSSTRPLKETLGRPGAGDADPEAAAVAKQDFSAFAETQRQRRLEQLQSRRR